MVERKSGRLRNSEARDFSRVRIHDKMSLIQLIITRGKEFISLKSVAYQDNDALAHVLHFNVDPVNSEQWSEFMRHFKEE